MPREPAARPAAERVTRPQTGEGAPQWGGLAALSRRQSAVVSIEQLHALALSDDRVALLVAQGRLLRLHRGVYADGLARLAPRGRLFAAQLALGPSAFLSHRTALAVHGVRALDVRRIEVTVVSGHTPRRDGVFVHRTSTDPPATEVRTVDGLRVAAPWRALIEVAAFERDGELDRLIAGLARRRLLDLGRIDAAIARRAGVRGIVSLRAALARYRPAPPDASTLERDFAAWLATHAEIAAPERNLHLQGDGARWELDFLWPAQRLVVETDGSPYHLTPSELERDRVKDAWLQRHGYRVLRVTDFRFAHDRSGILDDLRALIGGRRAA